MVGLRQEIRLSLIGNVAVAEGQALPLGAYHQRVALWALPLGPLTVSMQMGGTELLGEARSEAVRAGEITVGVQMMFGLLR